MKPACLITLMNNITYFIWEPYSLSKFLLSSVNVEIHAA